MNRNTFYGFLISGGSLWMIASIILIAGSFKDLADTSSYQIQICKISNGMIEIDGTRTSVLYNVNVLFQYQNITSWIIVYITKSNTSALNYLNNIYQIGQNKACFVSNDGIVLSLQHQYYTVLSSGIIFLISFCIILTLMILRCIEERRHKGYTDVEPLEQQEELNNPVRRSPKDKEKDDPFYLVLKSTDEASRVLYINRKLIDKAEYSRLRILQVDAVSGTNEKAMSHFRAEVYKTITAIPTQ
jgi:heat shock protein HspQ